MIFNFDNAKISYMIEKITDSIKYFVRLTWGELVDWIYKNNNSLTDYIIKVIIAIFIYIFISDLVKKLFRKIDARLDEKSVNHRLSSICLGMIKYLILTCIIITEFDYLNKIEVSPLITMVVFLSIFLLLVVKGFFTRLITKAMRNLRIILRGEDYDYYSGITTIDMPHIINSKSMRELIRFIFKLAGVAIATLVIYFFYQGIIYMMETGGREISRLFMNTDNVIEAELKTHFEEDLSLRDDIPVYTKANVSIKTDGDLNIVYLNGNRIGFNTFSRKYKIYGIAINEQEIRISRRLFFPYDEILQSIETSVGGTSKTLFYHNIKNDDCVVIMINQTSNRVVSVSYFKDFESISETLMLTVD